MKALKPNDVYIEVPVSERIPKNKEHDYACVIDSQIRCIADTETLEAEKKEESIFSDRITHWLEKQSLFCFTEEELREHDKKTFQAGRNFEYNYHFGEVPNPYPDQETFISNLFKPTTDDTRS